MATVTRKRSLLFGLVGGATFAATIAACGRDATPSNPIVTSARPSVAGRPDAGPLQAKLPEWTYWEPIEVPIVGNAHAPDMPLSDSQIVRIGGAEGRWSAAPALLKDDLRRQGFAVATAGAQGRTRLGTFYAKLRETQTPFVITLDTLFYLSHMALDRALADVERTKLAPALETVLTRLDSRLLAESKDARADLAPAYQVARGLIAVAAALAIPGYAPAPDIAELVNREKAKVLAHAGPSDSPLLAVPLDYSAMAPRGMADKDDARVGFFRAMAWLGQAPLMLAGMGEEGAAGKVSVAHARTHARAALVISRLLDSEVDREAAQAWERIERLSQFIAGPADDLTPRELARAAAGIGNDLRDARWIANIARVDKLRHLATGQHVTRLYDGAGGVRIPLGIPDGATGPLVRAAPSLRLIGGRAAPDGEVLQGLVFPMVGAVKRGHAPPSTARDGERTIPTGLDIAAWLGSAEARVALREADEDAYDGYDTALDRLYARRPPEGAVGRHSSLYVSSLDAIASYVAPSSADRAQPGAATGQWRRRKIEVALAAWTELRHDAVSFTRLAMPASNDAPGSRSDNASTPAFVEPHPEAIAKLVALVRQTTRGLSALGGLDKESPARAILAEIDDILWSSLGIALREANDEPFSPDEAAALAAVPARIAALESRLSLTGIADVPLVVDVHTDLGPARVLEEATGYIRDVYMVIPEPRTRQLILAVGASIPHYEFLQPSASRLADSAWRARLASGPAPQPHAFGKGYVVERGDARRDATASAAPTPTR